MNFPNNLVNLTSWIAQMQPLNIILTLNHLLQPSNNCLLFFMSVTCKVQEILNI